MQFTPTLARSRLRVEGTSHRASKARFRVKLDLATGRINRTAIVMWQLVTMAIAITIRIAAAEVAAAEYSWKQSSSGGGGGGGGQGDGGNNS